MYTFNKVRFAKQLKFAMLYYRAGYINWLNPYDRDIEQVHKNIIESREDLIEWITVHRFYRFGK